MSRIIVCDSCDERISAGISCVSMRTYEDEIAVTWHYHVLCWERNQDVMVTMSRLRAGGVIGRETILSVVQA